MFGGHVFPACAGMFLACRADPNSPLGFPRVRGDVPTCKLNKLTQLGFSPRARGCSEASIVLLVVLFVFPACAGMFLIQAQKLLVSQRFPRVRGDVPIGFCNILNDVQFSPRARGCSSE